MRFTHLNSKPIPLSEDEDSPKELPERKTINVHGRKEHEALLKDHKKCEELGLDPIYETIVYLKRWGGWLSDEQSGNSGQMKEDK